jgi:hypothetical protein
VSSGIVAYVVEVELDTSRAKAPALDDVDV